MSSDLAGGKAFHTLRVLQEKEKLLWVLLSVSTVSLTVKLSMTYVCLGGLL